MKHTNPRHRHPRISAIEQIEQRHKTRKLLGLKSPREIRHAQTIGR
jgi:hypothetical protein